MKRESAPQQRLTSGIVFANYFAGPGGRELRAIVRRIAAQLTGPSVTRVLSPASVIVTALTIAACSLFGATLAPPAAPLTAPARLCSIGETRPCWPVQHVESWLRNPNLEILGSSPTAEGIQGARVLTLSVPTTTGRAVFRAKWRSYDTTGGVHVPRRELAAYAIQQLFLEPSEYVVPPTSGHCFPLDEYRLRVEQTARASFPGTRCAFGFLSYWLEDALSLNAAESETAFDSDRGPLDRELFESNLAYRRSVGNVNLLTFLIDHDDSHDDQFVIRHLPHALFVYSVDHSLSFDAPTNPHLDRDEDWSRILVPALPRDGIAHLLNRQPNDLARLSSIEQYVNVDGVLRFEKTPMPSRAPHPIRWATRDRLQVGLSSVELDMLRKRLDALKTVARENIYRLF